MRQHRIEKKVMLPDTIKNERAAPLVSISWVNKKARLDREPFFI